MSATPSGRPRPFVLAIMDGWGINPRKDGNAIALAHTPNINRLVREWPSEYRCGEARLARLYPCQRVD